MKYFSLRNFIFLFTVIKFSYSISKKIFVFNQTSNKANRRIFVRDFEQIYICPYKKGWEIPSDILKGNLRDKNSLLFTKRTPIGLYQIKCENNRFVIEIIDSIFLDIILSPPMPKKLSRGEKYFFQVLLQPFGINEDSTFIWSAYQISGLDKIELEKNGNNLFININETVRLGDYSIGLLLDLKVKTIKFRLIERIHRKPVSLDLPRAEYLMDSIRSLNRFFVTFMILGLLLIIISILIYICAILFTKRDPPRNILGHKNLLVEEECVLDDETKQCYKVMNNPMSREKDVELILEKAREMGANMTSRSPLGQDQCSFGSLSKYSIENNPYGVTQETMSFLREKFSKGVCLNCVKLASQLILLNKEDCPSIMHSCNDIGCLYHNKSIRCLCAEMQINDTSPQTFDLYNAAANEKRECQIQNYNNNNISDDVLAPLIWVKTPGKNYFDKPKFVEETVNNIEQEVSYETYGMITPDKPKVNSIYLDPKVPNIMLKSLHYLFKIKYTMDENVKKQINISNLRFFLTSFPSNPSSLAFIEDGYVCFYPAKLHKSGVYNYSLHTDFTEVQLLHYLLIGFQLIDKKLQMSEIHTNLRDFYFRKLSISIIFHLKFYPQYVQAPEFQYRMLYDSQTFKFENRSLRLKVHQNLSNVYRLKLYLFYKPKNNSLVGIWRTYIILIDYKRMREELTDQEMDASVSQTRFQVDYNDPIYRQSTYDPVDLPAIPNSPRAIVTNLPDMFNSSGISLPHLMMIFWMIFLLGLIILTFYFGNCQHHFWVPLDREVVEIDPLDKSAGFGMCFFDFWLNMVGHDKEEEHCFFDMWRDKYGYEFPNGICRECITNSAQLISENRLAELTTFDNQRDCRDGNCQFPFFQRQLRIYDDRVAGFDCETCSKEAYIQLLRTSYLFTQSPNAHYEVPN